MYNFRFAEKQLKLHRLKANRKYVQDRCEAILRTKRKHDDLVIDTKQCKERIKLIHLAIEQRKKNIYEKQLELKALKQYNCELRQKLPKYEKRVATVGKHAQSQAMELENKSRIYDEQAQSLAALRRSRIRQLIKYIFPVYVTYDTRYVLFDFSYGIYMKFKWEAFICIVVHLKMVALLILQYLVL